MIRRAAIPVVLVVTISALSFWRATGVHEVTADSKAAAAAVVLPKPAAGDHPWWRGLHCNGVSDAAAKAYPVHWSADDVRWKAAVPGKGHASPCVSGDQAFVFTADEKSQTHWLLSFERSSGREQWRAEVNQGGFARIHHKNSQASATPACDAQRVFVCFAAHGSLWVVGIDRSGQVQWKTQVGPYESTHGYGSSPALYGSLVIVAGDNRGARIDRLVGSSFLAAVDRETGQVVWRIKRPAVDNYATPVVAEVAGKPQLLLAGHETVTSYDPVTGHEIWRCRWKAANAANTMAFDEECVYASTTERNPLMLCIRADGQGDVTDTHIVWREQQGAPYVPTPLIFERRVYAVNDKGVLTCWDAATGQLAWKQRLGGNFSASPVVADGLIYALNEAGKAYVVQPGEKFELVAENDCGEETLATPACCGGDVFLRTKHSLLCIRGQEKGADDVARQVGGSLR